jgi:hypothetical protein
MIDVARLLQSIGTVHEKVLIKRRKNGLGNESGM